MRSQTNQAARSDPRDEDGDDPFDSDDEDELGYDDGDVDDGYGYD